MKKYVINEGLETEEVIVASRAIEGNIQWWFYDASNRAQETRLICHVLTIREAPQISAPQPGLGRFRLATLSAPIALTSRPMRST